VARARAAGAAGAAEAAEAAGAAWAAGAAGAAEAAWAAWAAEVWKKTPGSYYDKRAAVREAGREWGRKHFADTITEMQASAEDLLVRMCAVGRAA
jgi:hypothetical protein